MQSLRTGKKKTNAKGRFEYWQSSNNVKAELVQIVLQQILTAQISLYTSLHTELCTGLIIESIGL
jgi:hypothetical protein